MGRWVLINLKDQNDTNNYVYIITPYLYKQLIKLPCQLSHGLSLPKKTINRSQRLYSQTYIDTECVAAIYHTGVPEAVIKTRDNNLIVTACDACFWHTSPHTKTQGWKSHLISHLTSTCRQNPLFSCKAYLRITYLRITDARRTNIHTHVWFSVTTATQQQQPKWTPITVLFFTLVQCMAVVLHIIYFICSMFVVAHAKFHDYICASGNIYHLEYIWGAHVCLVVVVFVFVVFSLFTTSTIRYYLDSVLVSNMHIHRYIEQFI